MLNATCCLTKWFTHFKELCFVHINIDWTWNLVSPSLANCKHWFNQEKKGQQKENIAEIREIIRFQFVFIASVIESILKLFNWKWFEYLLEEFSHAFLPRRIPRVRIIIHSKCLCSRTSGRILCFIDYLSVCLIRHISLYLHLLLFITLFTFILCLRLNFQWQLRLVPPTLEIKSFSFQIGFQEKAVFFPVKSVDLIKDEDWTLSSMNQTCFKYSTEILLKSFYKNASCLYKRQTYLTISNPDHTPLWA